MFCLLCVVWQQRFSKIVSTVGDYMIIFIDINAVSLKILRIYGFFILVFILSIHNEFERKSHAILESDYVNFLYLCQFFLHFQRLLKEDEIAKQSQGVQVRNLKFCVHFTYYIIYFTYLYTHICIYNYRFLGCFVFPEKWGATR